MNNFSWVNSKNIKLILSRPDLQWLEEMIIPDSGLDVIGQSGIFDDNYFAGSLEEISILKNIYFQLLQFQQLLYQHHFRKASQYDP